MPRRDLRLFRPGAVRIGGRELCVRIHRRRIVLLVVFQYDDYAVQGFRCAVMLRVGCLAFRERFAGLVEVPGIAD